jgi:hypothetical protein
MPFLVVILVGMHAHAATTKCGAICTENWDLVGHPYIVTCDVTVGSGCTVTIDAGVEVRFQAATDLTIEGTLDVNGTSGSPVLFTSDSLTPAPGDWDYIDLRGTASATFDFATVEYANYGIYMLNGSVVTLNDVTARLNNWGLWASTTPTVTLNNVTVEQSTYDGLRVRNATISGTGNSFVNNNRHGVQVEAMAATNSFSLQGSEIHSNGSLGLLTTGGIDVERFFLDVRNIWWGTTDPAAISAAIWDHVDNAGLPVADHCDYLDGPGGVPVVDAHCPDLTVCDGTTNLALTDKPYLMTSDMVVCSTGTLEVGPGVTVLADPDSNLKEIFVNGGTVDVNGASGAEAIFTSRAAAPAPGDWDGFHLQGSANGTFDFAIVEYADRGLYMLGSTTAHVNDVTARFNTWGIWADTTPTVTLNNVTVEQSAFDGLRVRKATVTGTGNSFVNNSRHGVQVEAMAATDSIWLHDGEIHSNGSLGLYTTGGIDVERFFLDVRNNWWGTTNPSLIGAAIHDHTNHPGLPVADRCDYLDGPGGIPVVDAHCPDLTVCDGVASLTLTDKPYLMNADIVVCSTGTLEVGPGVTLLVDPDPALLEILVDGGTVDVNGNLGSGVTFRSRAAAPTSGDWDGFDAVAGASVSVDHALVEHADRGFFIRDSSTAALDRVTTRESLWGVWVDGAGATATLNRVVSIDNDFDGIRAEGPVTVNAIGCVFTDNTRYGVYLHSVVGDPDFGIAASSLYGNQSGFDLLTASGWSSPAATIVRATDNWWGTTDDATIRARIWDYQDDTSKPRVYHRAFGDTCEFAVGRDGDGDGVGDFEDDCPNLADVSQTDADGDGMGDVCDPDPLNPPTGVCDGINDVIDGYADADGDGWGDLCDIQLVDADSYPGAAELCDGRDNDGDGNVAAGELTDDDFDEGMLCGDCDDFEPAVNVCRCENCTNIIDDDCNGLADGADPVCMAVPNCILLTAGIDPTLKMHKGACGGAAPSGLFDVVRGELVQIAVVGGSIDLGNLACVGDDLAWDRVTDLSADPTNQCGGTPCLFYLARNDGASDFGNSSSGEPRDIMDPDPPCP